MPSSYHGTGTMFYGRSMRGDDGSAVVTEWFTLFGLPLVPLGSHRVLYQVQVSRWWGYRATIAHGSKRVPLYLPHLFQGWAITAGVIGFLAVAHHYRR